MKSTTYFLFFWTLFYFLLHCASKDPEVSCVFMESCALPCSFHSGADPVIHWTKKPNDVPVHIYYYGQNQFNHQHEDYRGRTSLFEEEISRGNASLLLSQVKVQDEGRYRCYTNTAHQGSKVSFINLNVFAPVVDVSLEQRGEELLCRSEGIYPQPEVSWTPSTEHHTTVETTESGLYSVVSSVRLPHSPPHEHSCNVSTLHSWRSATYRMGAPIITTGSEVTIPCTDSTSTVKSLIWKFNLTQIICNRTGSELVYSESWRQFVDRVSESNNSLVLKKLTSDQQGLYSCVLRTDTEMYFINTRLEEPGIPLEAIIIGCSVGAGLLLLVLIAVVTALILRRCRPRESYMDLMEMIDQIDQKEIIAQMDLIDQIYLMDQRELIDQMDEIDQIHLMDQRELIAQMDEIDQVYLMNQMDRQNPEQVPLIPVEQPTVNGQRTTAAASDRVHEDPHCQTSQPKETDGLLEEQQEQGTSNENQPVETKNQPLETKNQTAETENQSAGTENQPAETKNQTAETENQPAETENQPAETENQTAETENQIAETENQPAETENQTAETMIHDRDLEESSV